MSTNLRTGFQQPYFIVSWAEFGVSILLLGVRCYTAFYIVQSIRCDLYLTILTFIFGTASMVMLTIAATKGLGTHESLLSDADGTDSLLYGWLNQILALLAIGLGKLSIVAFLEHIQGYKTIYRTVFLWTLAGTNMVVNIIAATLALLQCDPANKLWNQNIPGDCSGERRIQLFGYFQGAWSALCDFGLALFPIFLFSRVQAFSIPTRIGLCMLMGSGIVAGACAIVKTIQLERLTVSDATYQLGIIIIWNQTEMWVVFIVSCIPPTKVFFARLIRKGTTSVSSK